MTDAQRAAELVRKALVDSRKPFTVADASAAAGIPLRDAEAALNVLTSEYRGHLRVTDDGDLVHVFPNGFTKPWEKKEAFDRVVAKIGGALLGVGRFLVRAWLLVVMVAYAALFIALLIGLMFAGKSNDRDDRGGLGDLIGGLLRVLFEAFYWTFHPWSPFYVEGSTFQRRERTDDAEKIPFYEKVNRFVFGPAVPPVDPQATRAKILAEIRARKGRIGLADVMRVTGLPREEADPMMARLMLDHDGTVDVGEQGGIVYRFESMRRTADDGVPAHAPRPAWETPPVLPPLTGNTAGANVGIAALNVFNAFVATFVISNGLTVANIVHLFEHRPRGAPPIFEPGGVPIALGVVPLVFSLAVLALPVVRTVMRGRAEKKVAEENARLAILREVLARAPKKQLVPDEVLQTAYRVATGETPTSKEITKRVVELGGDVDVGPEGEVRYRFADLEAEAEALEDERAAASEREAKLGKIVFTSEN